MASNFPDDPLQGRPTPSIQEFIAELDDDFAKVFSCDDPAERNRLEDKVYQKYFAIIGLMAYDRNLLPDSLYRAWKRVTRLFSERLMARQPHAGQIVS